MIVLSDYTSYTKLPISINPREPFTLKVKTPMGIKSINTRRIRLKFWWSVENELAMLEEKSKNYLLDKWLGEEK